MSTIERTQPTNVDAELLYSLQTHRVVNMQERSDCPCNLKAFRSYERTHGTIIQAQNATPPAEEHATTTTEYVQTAHHSVLRSVNTDT